MITSTAMNEASLEPTDADKGKQLLNAGALLQVAESPCAAVDALSITNFICFFFFW